MTAATFKAQCLALMDDVAQGGTEIIITKRGTPVARLVAASPVAATAWGWMQGTSVESGDLVAAEPVWEAGPDPLDEA
jgi:prevent-host-death family protein